MEKNRARQRETELDKEGQQLERGTELDREEQS